ncbi:MAG: non-canonical purine NTP pyrophosphatase [Actinomycetota bacterium]|nr:non-canonical purine NTP pyrophosphatase [Actinomycetota bacterium]
MSDRSQHSDPPLELVCASANPHKVAEIELLLAGAVTLVARPASVPDVVEDAETLVGNARLKAIAIVEATSRPAVADDTGLEVDALDGAPGARAGRFAGDDASYVDNRARLLSMLADVPDDGRTARFRTVALVRWPDGSEVVAEGVCEGRIAEAERGDGGFGYDSLFVPDDGDGHTFAEMDVTAKQESSQRGRAFRDLLTQLRNRPPNASRL